MVTSDKALKELYLNNNQIGVVQKQVFKNLRNLEHLDLSYNLIGAGMSQNSKIDQLSNWLNFCSSFPSDVKIELLILQSL